MPASRPRARLIEAETVHETFRDRYDVCVSSFKLFNHRRTMTRPQTGFGSVITQYSNEPDLRYQLLMMICHVTFGSAGLQQLMKQRMDHALDLHRAPLSMRHW